MLKFILLTLVATALAKENKLYSLHAPEFMRGSLGLTTGELKQFSGHAMNIIQAKCPSVDAQKIFQIQKYIGKLIAKNEPVQGKSETFKRLLETMTTCAKEGVVPKPESDRPNIFTPFFHPMRHIKTLWFRRPEPMPQIDEGSDEELISNVDTGLTQQEDAPTVEDLPIVPTPSSEEPMSSPHIVKTTIFVRPQEMQEGIRNSGGFFNWIHNMFSRVTSFISNMFPFGSLRKKRDVSEFEPIMDLQDEAPKTEQGKTFVPEMETAPTFSVWAPKKDDSKGKKAFGKLIDEMCRLYCDTCTGHKEIMNFKLAAKELLTYLFNEDTGLELAASKFIDEEFLHSVQNCEE